MRGLHTVNNSADKSAQKEIKIRMDKGAKERGNGGFFLSFFLVERYSFFIIVFGLFLNPMTLHPKIQNRQNPKRQTSHPIRCEKRHVYLAQIIIFD